MFLRLTCPGTGRLKHEQLYDSSYRTPFGWKPAIWRQPSGVAATRLCGVKSPVRKQYEVGRTMAGGGLADGHKNADSDCVLECAPESGQIGLMD